MTSSYLESIVNLFIKENKSVLAYKVLKVLEEYGCSKEFRESIKSLPSSSLFINVSIPLETETNKKIDQALEWIFVTNNNLFYIFMMFDELNNYQSFLMDVVIFPEVIHIDNMITRESYINYDKKINKLEFNLESLESKVINPQLRERFLATIKALFVILNQK